MEGVKRNGEDNTQNGEYNAYALVRVRTYIYASVTSTFFNMQKIEETIFEILLSCES